MEHVYDALIVGCGIAGLSCAIRLKETGCSVVVITKADTLLETNTRYAQGGVVSACPDDSAELLGEDIIRAGGGYNRRDAVEIFAREAPELVQNFLVDRVGAKLVKTAEGTLHYTGEAAHSVRRVAHDNDRTGKTLQQALLARAQALGIPLVTGRTAVDIITNDHHSDDVQEVFADREVMGLYVLDNASGTVETWCAHAVVLATGGGGNLFHHTTNPALATGDGISMAHRAGAETIHMEFVQFHPTCFFHSDIKRFLISEALRGEGGRIVDHRGRPFMKEYSPLADLAPRDVVSRAIYDRMARSGRECMFLDLSTYYSGRESIRERFPTIYETCLQGGVDISCEPIPIVPAAHYLCGGVKADLFGRASVKNLYALGEVACTGLHGANRLASTSLLEGVFWGLRAADDIASREQAIKLSRLEALREWEAPSSSEEVDPLLVDQDMKLIQLTMWNYAGIIRTERGLRRADADLAYHTHRIMKFYRQARVNRRILELRNAVVSASLIVKGALRNKASAGCHHRMS
ncbi:L-aspartate oxidase [Alkalispirochaeta americana]|uniref:L-aspartate oxidase n=1 Tax=Alkalispirochaeta americana TaxID=159291 RepID=A0A1N6T548_9SPIO|nr:L-aspartate oxidase [Alkalispirochaeta americana]SIQ48256.1 L-aspartate oxidase [Alkalispirochaeta americana]